MRWSKRAWGWVLGAAWAAALALVLLPGVPAWAGGCYRTRAIYPTYSTYYAPSYSYTPSYSYVAPYQEKVAYQYEEVIVPKAIKAYVSPDYYSSVADYYRDRLLVDAMAGRAHELAQYQVQLQQLRQQLQQMQAVQQQRVVPAVAPAPAPPPGRPEETAREPAPRETGAATGSSYGPVPEKLGAVVQARCLRCHGASFADQGGGFDLRDLAGVEPGLRWKSYGLVNTGEMPKGARPLDDKEVLVFLDWARAGKTATARK